MIRLSRRFSATISAMALVASLAGTAPALAQSGQAAPAEDEAANEADEIIVTGTAGGGTRRQDASYAVTAISDDQIRQIAPASTSELLKAIPGVSAESSGGQNGANIFVRGFPGGGDAPFVTLQLNGVPYFAPPTLSFLENSQLFRIDETLERVEGVRGGTGALFSSGQPGLTVNFVQKEGRDEFAGLLKLTAFDYGEGRVDGVVSGPIGENTTFLLGGFYHSGDGVRSPQFNAEKGGQISANVRHNFENGSLLVYARYQDDKGQFLLPVPVVQNGKKISNFAGFDGGTGTFLGNETRLLRLPDGTTADIADGRGAQVVNLGANFEYDLSDNVTLRNRTSFLKGDADTLAPFPDGSGIMTAAQFAVLKGGAGSTVQSLTFVNGGGAVANAANQLVLQNNVFVVRKNIESFVNDAALEFESGGNKLTVGGYYASYSSRDTWNLGNGELLAVEPNARLLNLTITNGAGVTQQVTQNGFAQGAFFRINDSFDGNDYALYGVDEFQITPELRIDGGIRFQRHEIEGTSENNSSVADIDGNPNTLYDRNVAVLNGTFSNFRVRNNRTSFTAGANYDFSKSLGAFARFSRGYNFPFFDDVRGGVNTTTRVDSYELGVKASTDLFNFYATFFHNDFAGLTSQQLTGTVITTARGGARTNGIEVEGVVRPLPGLQIAFSGTYLDGKYRNFFTQGGTIDDSGNQIQRQPKYQYRFLPSYSFDLGASKLTLFGSIAYIGNRFSDIENQQLLPNYTKVDAGITFDLNDRLEFQVTADNLTDTIGLTEGNPRLLGSQGSGTILARPILGRSFRFSAAYKF